MTGWVEEAPSFVTRSPRVVAPGSSMAPLQSSSQPLQVSYLEQQSPHAHELEQVLEPVVPQAVVQAVSVWPE